MIRKLLYKIYDFFTFKQIPNYNYYKQLDNLSVGEIREYQLSKLKTNPLIRINSWEEFVKLPITTKKDLPNSPVGQEYRQHETSGSTGQPRVIWVPKEAWSRKDAIFTRSWEKMGRKESDLVLRLVSGEPQYPFYDYLRNVHPMNYKTIGQAHVDWVVKNKPFLIHGPGGAIRQLCELLISQGHEDILKDIKIHWCSESSRGHRERLLPFVKEFHEQYGLAELPTVGAPDGLGAIKVVSEMGVVEILDDDGNRCDYGQEGYIVVTDFNNTVTPIVRYKSGDRGRMSLVEIFDGDTCRGAYEVLHGIIGRGVDYYNGPEVKRAIGWWVVAPISHTMGNLVSKWRCEVNIPNRILTLFVRPKCDFDPSRPEFLTYKEWVKSNVGLDCEIKEISAESDEKYDILWKNKLVKVITANE